MEISKFGFDRNGRKKLREWQGLVFLLFSLCCCGKVSSWNYKANAWSRISRKSFSTRNQLEASLNQGEVLWTQNDLDDGMSERHFRFAGIGRLYSSGPDEQLLSDLPPHLAVVESLNMASVAVIGLGGVGSWAAEALCRSGVGNLILIDLDDICISNTNRQLHATSSTVGQMKIDEMKRRLMDINPQCNVSLIHDFVTIENVGEIMDACGPITAVVEAIDGTKEKTAILAECVHRGIPVVTSGASAGRLDLTKIVCEDLVRVDGDRLLGNCRRNLRKFYGFEAGLSFHERRKSKKQKDWNILAIYSTEVLKPVCRTTSDVSSFRVCDGPLGTACFVTGTFGFMAAARVVDMIATKKFILPRLQGHCQHEQEA